MPFTILYSLIGCIAVVLWGISIVWVRTLTEAFGGIRSIILIHCVVAPVSLAIWLSLGRKQQMLEALKTKWFYIRAGLFCVSGVAFYYAVSLVSHERVPVVILISYLWPTLTLLSSVAILKIPVPRMLWFVVGTLLVATAITSELFHDYRTAYHLISSSRSNDILAYVIAFLGAGSWALYSTISRGWGDISGGPAATPLFSFIAIFIGSIILLTYPLPEAHWTSQSVTWWLIGGLANVAGFWAWDLGVRRGNIVLLSLTADIIPWLSLASAYFFLGAAIHQNTIWNALLLVLGAVSTRFGTRKSSLITK